MDDIEALIDATGVRGHRHYFVHRGRWWACIVPSCTVRQIYPSRGTAA